MGKSIGKRLKWQSPKNCPPFGCCVEVARPELGKVLVRSSKNKRRRVGLTFEEFDSFVAAVKNGEYDQIGIE